jgi:hypothetical protein
MTFLCKWGCGTLLDTDPSITTVTGRQIPLSCGIPHDCSLSPHHKGINSRLKVKVVANSTEEQKAVIEEDKLNRQTCFDLRTQIYPADLFILEGFDSRRDPRWHDDKGYFIGRSK